MEVIVSAVNWFLGLGSSVIVPIVLIFLGLIFKVGFAKAVRGGVITGIGLAGLNLITNLIVVALQPAVQALADRLGIVKDIVDINWADAGIAWGWPGVAGVVLGIIVVNIIMLVLRLTKTLWVDVWSYWHGSALAGFVWAMTNNILLGVIAGVLYLVIGGLFSDITAKKFQEFNDMPGIGVPCGTTVQAAIFAIPVVWVLDRIPGLKDLDASPENIRKRLGLVGEPAILGLLLGIIIGIAAGYNVQQFLGLGMQVATMMVVLPRMVSLIAEGIVPITLSIVQYMKNRFKDRELYVAVDCAVLLGHPAVMASSVILFPLYILLAAVLPGVRMLPIASLAVVPFWAGAVVPYTKGNVIKTVIVLLLYAIPFMYLGTLLVNSQTQTYQMMNMYSDQIAQGLQLGSWDMGGDPLGSLIRGVFSLFGR
jgi:PTS system galactitol-specific IIC component